MVQDTAWATVWAVARVWGSGCGVGDGVRLARVKRGRWAGPPRRRGGVDREVVGEVLSLEVAVDVPGVDHHTLGYQEIVIDFSRDPSKPTAG